MARLLYGLLWTSYRVGGAALCDALWGGRVKILMYHGVTARDSFDGVTNLLGFNIPATAFERHLEYLGTQCHVVGLDALRTASGLSRTKPNVVLTFDDGYENNYEVAFPLLRRYGMPAVFALPTGFVCRQEPLWNDIVEHAVNRSRRPSVRFAWDGTPREFPLADVRDRVVLNRWLLEQLVRVDQGRRDARVGEAVDALGVDGGRDALLRDEDYRPLTRSQVSELAASGLIEFASHSVHHYLLAKLDGAMRRRELDDSKREIEQITGRPCTTLSLPGGSYDDDVLRDAMASGYRFSLTSDFGGNVPGTRTLNRIIVRHRVSSEKFANALQKRC